MYGLDLKLSIRDTVHFLYVRPTPLQEKNIAIGIIKQGRGGVRSVGEDSERVSDIRSIKPEDNIIFVLRVVCLSNRRTLYYYTAIIRTYKKTIVILLFGMKYLCIHTYMHTLICCSTEGSYLFQRCVRSMSFEKNSN